MSPRRPKQASHLATALIEHSSDAIALLDESGAVLYANPATARMLGLPIDAVIGTHVFRWVHEDDVAAFRTNFEEQLRERGVPIRHAFRLRHSDGTWRSIESIGVNRLQDPTIQGVIVNYRDVTDRRAAEAALANSELRFRRFIEDANDLIYDCDLEGHFTFVNRTTLELLKYTEEELLGRHFLTLIRSDHRERVATFYDRQRKKQIPSTYLEFPVVDKEGREAWIGQNLQLQYDGNQPVGVQAIARDITERLALEEQLRQAQKMEAIGRLAGGLAHDFNNVLTAILGSADLLSAQLSELDPRREEANAIKQAADRGALLTRRLLEFSRPHHSTAGPASLMMVARKMEPMLRRLLLDKVAIEMTGTDTIQVQADESQLSQILMNLVVNARDAMRDGGTVTIGIDEAVLSKTAAAALRVHPGRYGKLVVADTGHGIAASAQKHLFEPFFTTKPSEHGSGLGLSIVYGIVTGQGGAIEVWSEIGRGARFTIYLPAVA
jgi:two-component system, cell cycle sensor histidine kinase and response regulator CckA